VDHFVALCRPKTVEPIVLDLDSDRCLAELSLPQRDLLDLGSLRLQITGLEGPFPQYEMRPTDTMPPRGKVQVTFADVMLSSLALQVKFDPMARRGQVEISLWYQPPGEANMKPCRGKEAEQMAHLSAFYRAVNKRGKIHFCVFNQFGNRQVLLLTTSPPSPATR
jgi:hypothetical protein